MNTQPKMFPMLKKELAAYCRTHYPGEAAEIEKRAEALYPALYAKAPDLGGKENNLAYNMDLFLTAVAFYEASSHRIDGPAILEIANDLAKRYRFVTKLVDINRPWQMQRLKSLMYRRYTPLAEKIRQKKTAGEWGNTWEVDINPQHHDEGVAFDLVGCPLADYANANGYQELLPYLCATDRVVAGLFGAKLIRTHTVATGSASCDYWYVPSKSDIAKRFPEEKLL